MHAGPVQAHFFVDHEQAVLVEIQYLAPLSSAIALLY
jgi:hypothetical protein